VHLQPVNQLHDPYVSWNCQRFVNLFLSGRGIELGRHVCEEVLETAGRVCGGEELVGLLILFGSNATDDLGEVGREVRLSDALKLISMRVMYISSLPANLSTTAQSRSREATVWRNPYSYKPRGQPYLCLKP